MPILPTKRTELILFVEGHTALWTTNATAIGLTTTQVTALTTAAAAARTSLTATEVAREASKGATDNFYNKTRDLSDLAADALKAIKSKAAATNDPNVFVLANIPAPLPPSPPPPLTAPTDVIANPNPDGTVSVKWKGSTAYQTFFGVWRKVTTAAGEGPWISLGSTAQKTWMDSTVTNTPPPVRVDYAIKSQRSDAVSLPGSAYLVYGGPGVGFFSGGVVGVVGGATPGTLQQAA